MQSVYDSWKKRNSRCFNGSIQLSRSMRKRHFQRLNPKHPLCPNLGIVLSQAVEPFGWPLGAQVDLIGQDKTLHLSRAGGVFMRHRLCFLFKRFLYGKHTISRDTVLRQGDLPLLNGALRQYGTDQESNAAR